jgi:enoyl-CoA hydratase/carnithine racemase
VPAEEAVALGLAQRVLEPDEAVPLAAGGSLAALTIARDLARSSVRREGAGLRLELASFRLLFASGDPEEGARAFLERRPPSFD